MTEPAAQVCQHGLAAVCERCVPPGPEQKPQWEAVADDDGQFWRVRWSEQDAEGMWLYVRHYPEQWRAESDAKRLNEQGRAPWEWPGWQTGDGRRAIITETYEGDCTVYVPKDNSKEQVFTLPECPFNYCDQEGGGLCREHSRCRHAR